MNKHLRKLDKLYLNESQFDKYVRNRSYTLKDLDILEKEELQLRILGALRELYKKQDEN